MKAEHCSNCGFPLTAENIRLAVEDAGLPQEELVFCCPSYGEMADEETDEKYEACQGYSNEDRVKPAYWRTN